MKKARFLLLLVVISVSLASAKEVFNYPDVTRDVEDISFYEPAKDNANYQLSEKTRPCNVIFMIGDGMSFDQVNSAMLQAVGVMGKLYMEKMPVTGIVKTSSANKLVTDSAAGVTALACGIKTNNGMVGVDPNGQSYYNILQLAQDKGFKTGIVATSTISHATPAGFSAHIKSRNDQISIAKQQADSGINVILGGGKKFWLPKKMGGDRSDGLDLLASCQAKGYAVVDNSDELLSAVEDRNTEFILGLFQDEAMTTFSPEPTIEEMTRSAIKILSKKKPSFFGFGANSSFFLMVEGSQIDWACHANNEDNSIKQVLLFDLAVKAALEFAIEDGNTLVVVTSDHETGGMAVVYPKKDKPLNIQWISKSHTARPVPVYAFGPGARFFTGTMENTEVPAKIAECLKIGSFPLIKSE